MQITHDVQFRQIQRRVVTRAQRGTVEIFVVRWAVARKPRSRSFQTAETASRFRAELWQASLEGIPFRVDTGLPQRPSRGPSFLEFSRAFIRNHWDGWAGRTRETSIYALMSLIPAVVDEEAPGRPGLQIMRETLRDHVLLPVERRRDLREGERAALDWMEATSLPVADMDAAVVRKALSAICVNFDGSRAAARTVLRRKQVLHHLLELAKEDGHLSANPLQSIRWSPPRVAEALDPRSVVSPEQARALLAAVMECGDRGRAGRIHGAFACMYFAALRPEEVLGLRIQDCDLPEGGWGVLHVERARPSVGKRWSDSGLVHDDRQLKHRALGEVREVPIPPELVSLLSQHYARYGAEPDGRLFRTPSGAPYAHSALSRVWKQARELALTPEQAASPLARRPYDLRHAAVSLWLSAGLSVAEVARRAGHGIDVLLKTYAKCIDGQRDADNRKISSALRGASG